MEEAASIPLVGLTAWQALIEMANLQKGQKVFIQAGSGGVGTFAIQLAIHLGAFVATTTSTANVDWVKRLGADIVIDYKKDDFENVLHGYDVVLNSQDGETLAKSLSVLKPGGILISISGPPDPAFGEGIRSPWFLKSIMRLLSFGIRRKAKRSNVSFSFLFMKANGGQLREITALIDSGAIRPVVDKVFPFKLTGGDGLRRDWSRQGQGHHQDVMNMALPGGHSETPGGRTFSIGGMVIGYATNARKVSVKSAAVCKADFLKYVYSGCKGRTSALCR